LLCCAQVLLAGVQVQENTVNRFSFTWDMEGLSIADSGGKPSSLFFKNQSVELGDSGQPLIPGYSFYIGIPPKGDVQIQLVPLSIRTIVLKNSLATYKAVKRHARYPDLVFSDTWLSNGRPATMGNIRSRQFILKPFLYDEKTRSLRILEKASCVVTFPPSSQGMTGAAGTPTDYQRMISRLMLNYSIAGAWATASRGAPKRAGGQAFPLASNNSFLTFTIGDGHDSTNEGTTLENGLLKIPGDSLRKMGSTIFMSQVACFASYKGEMPTQTPDISVLPDGVTEIPLLRFDLNGNGIVDPEDYVVGYVTGSSDWAWDTSAGRYYYNLDRYEDYRHYWITVKPAGGMALQRTTAVAGSDPATINSFTNHILFKQPQALSNKGGDVSKGEFSGLDWYWRMLTQAQPLFSFQVALPNIDTAFPVNLHISQGVSSGFSGINASFSNRPACSTCQASEWSSFKYSGNRALRISADNMNQGDYIEIVGFEFTYTTDLDMSNSKSLTVFSPETSSIVRYQLRNLPGEPVYIFRLDANESMRLVDTVTLPQGSSYTWTDSAGKGVKYFICGKSGFLQSQPCRVQTIQSTDNLAIRDLRSVNNQADFLVITHSDFMDQAIRLAQHKSDIGRFKSPKVVDVNDVYREFSGGDFDPAAIRNFLVYATGLWAVKPQYAVLMGKGHYNYKGILSSEPVFIPVYEWNDRCIDDFYAYLEPGAKADSMTPPIPKIFIGRLPCITDDQARQMVDKIIAMEDPATADLGAWRNRALLVNDDDMQGANTDPLGAEHFYASDAVATAIQSQRPSIDIRKVNLFEYPWNNVLEKPEARDALLSVINGGVSFANYFGHGNPGQWADERILNVALVSNLHNIKQYPLISSFSCSVGQFDKPGERCLSEALVVASQSGAIATIASLRQAYSDNNKLLALAFYTSVLDSSRIGVSYGEAYAQAKIIVRDQNSQIYSYLGDPSLCAVNPSHRVSLDIVNSKGAPVDTLMALQSITIRGSIPLIGAVTPDTRYGAGDKPAFVQLSMFNPPIGSKRKDKGTRSDPSYTLPGTPIFTGLAEVKNGVFEQTIHLPRSVTFDKPGAELIAYSWQALDNGLGCKAITFHGTDTSGANGHNDTVGPIIAIRALYDDAVLATPKTNNSIALTADKLQAVLPFKCEINVTDSMGIDVTGTGPDEGLTMEIPGSLSKQNINQKFSFTGGDYRKGTATVEFGEGQLRSGTYTLSISAQDLAGNITRRNFSMEILQSKDLAITRVFNFPNPMKMGKTTAFYFDMTKTSNVRSSIKLYSMSGRLLRVFFGAYSGEVFDGRDQMGNLLGPKVYLYQLTVEDLDQQKTVKSAIQKLVVHPPR